jgi:hypothetical protein
MLGAAHPPDHTMDSSPPSSHRNALLVASLALLATLYLTGGLAWLEADRLLFDGDESGHVGAAELFAAMWRSGRGGQALLDTFAGRMGVYPPLYAGLVGAWWALTGLSEPSAPLVQGLNLLSPLLAAAAVALLVRPLGIRPVLLAVVAVLALPLLAGLGRHFMLEGALAAAVAWTVLAVEWARARPTWWRVSLVGVVLGLATLCKQTAPLYLLPLLLLRLPRRPRSLLALAVAGIVVAPWALLNLSQQLGYGVESAAGTPGSSLWWHAGFYPWSLLWVAAGPALTVLAVAGAAAGARAADARQRQLLWVAALWLLGSLVLLGLVPRKYPRLLAPALPAIGLLVALAAARWRRGLSAWLLGGGLLAALAWTAWGSLRPLPVPNSARVLDDRCPQVWLRPFVDDDLGLSLAVEAVRHSRPGPVLVLGSATIPCSLQTTHDWSQHLGPALRFAGVDRELVTERDPARQAALVVSWQGPVDGYRGEATELPALEASLWIGRPIP